jgi:hypothetical protein
MIESLEELKAIDADAPDDASSVDAEGYYIKFSNGSYYCCASKLDSWRRIEKSELLTTRSLSDIKRIIELMELNQNMHTTVAGYIYGKDWEHWNEFNAGRFRL